MATNPHDPGPDRAATIFGLSNKKSAKVLDFSNAGFAQAGPGGTGYFPMNLTPGRYVFGCFLAEGGKKHGTIHSELGMVGEFTVS